MQRAAAGTHSFGGDHRFELIELPEDARHALVAIVMDRLLDDAYGVVRALVQVGPNLLEDVLCHVVEGVVCEHLWGRAAREP